MKKFEEFKFEERHEIVLLFANWLKQYSNEVVIKLLESRDEIVNNEFTMYLLRELKKREAEEEKDFNNSIGNLLMDYDYFKEYNVHVHPLQHADSYRDVLYDMYIRRI